LNKYLKNTNINIYTAENTESTESNPIKPQFVSMFEIKSKSTSPININSSTAYNGRLPFVVCNDTSIIKPSHLTYIYLFSTNIPYIKEKQLKSIFTGLDMRDNLPKKIIEAFTNISPESVRVDTEILKEKYNILQSKKDDLINKRSKLIKSGLHHNIQIIDSSLEKIKESQIQIKQLKKDMDQLYLEMEDSDSSLEYSVDGVKLNSISSNSSDVSNDSKSDDDTIVSSEFSDSSIESDVKPEWRVKTSLPNKMVAIASIISVDSSIIDKKTILNLIEILTKIGHKRVPIMSSIKHRPINHIAFDIMKNNEIKEISNNKKMLAVNLFGKVKFTPNDIYFNTNESNYFNITTLKYNIPYTKPIIVKSKTSETFYNVQSLFSGKLLIEKLNQ